jgi:virulence factor Mce-like protein
VRAGLLLAFVAMAVAAVPAFRAEGDSTYRVDVIFDTARGVIPGQLVKVAGASVGSIKEVKVTPGYKARVQLEVDRRFAPFRSDAECGIQPEGLIAENFVQCDPGTTRGRPLRGRGGEAPTVPVERTTLPVTLVDLFEVSSVPVRDRTRLLLNELGVGTMARGEDLNGILRRTNPALKAAERAIGILNRQRDQLGRIVSATDRVAGDLARRRGRVQDFIETSAQVTAVTSRHRGALAESVRRLPALLRTSRPALSALDRFTADAEPLVNQVRAAAPRLSGALRELRTFSRVGPEPLRGLRATLRRGRRITRLVKPFTRELAGFVGPSVPTTTVFASFLGDLSRRGFTEELLRFFYYGAAATARHDSVSHVFPSHVLSLPECTTYASKPVAGCEARTGTGTETNTASRGRSSSSNDFLDYLLR